MNGGGLKILLAEDNPAIAHVLRFNLERAGFSVTVAVDGREAIAAVEKEQFDAVVTDYQMPHVSGEEFCRQARQHAGHEDVPIFLCSAKGFELDVDRLREELRISGVFFKPFSPRQIVQTVRAAIEEGRVAV